MVLVSEIEREPDKDVRLQVQVIPAFLTTFSAVVYLPEKNKVHPTLP